MYLIQNGQKQPLDSLVEHYSNSKVTLTTQWWMIHIVLMIFLVGLMGAMVYTPEILAHMWAVVLILGVAVLLVVYAIWSEVSESKSKGGESK